MRNHSSTAACRDTVRAEILAGTAALAAMLLAGTALGQTAPGQTVTTRLETMPGALAQAQETAAFDIPAQSLSSALIAFANQSGYQVSVAHGSLADLRTAGVKGRFTPEEALRRLLADTGVTWRFQDDRTVVLAKGDASSGAITLDPVTVEGKTAPLQAAIGNLPPAYAGGQVARGGKLGILGNKDMMDTPFNQTNYTSKLIQDQHDRHISDVVRSDPAVIVTLPASSGIDGFAIRGFDFSNNDILFNGMSQVAPSFATSMTTEGFERVEVLKGPNALLTGMNPGSIGGSINLVPKRAGDEPLLRLTPDYAMKSEFGGHVDVGRRFGNDKELGVRFNGVLRDGDTPIDNQSRETRLAMLGLDLRKDWFRVEADAGYQYGELTAPRQNYSVANGVAIPDAPDASSNTSPSWEYFETESNFGAVRGEMDITSNITVFGSVGGYQRDQRRAFSSRTINNANGNLSAGNTSIRAETLEGFSTEAGFRGRFGTGPVDHQATAAYVFNLSRWSRVRSNYAFPASNLYAPVYSVAPATKKLSIDAARKFQDTDFGSFVVADTMSFLNERVQLTGGVRYQNVEVTSYNETTGNVTSAYDKSALTPMAGIVVKPRKDVSVYANYIEGLQQGGTAPAGTANEGQVFAPYVTEQYEAGVKWDTGTFGASFAAYQISLPDDYTNTATNTFVVDGIQRHRGLDLSVFGEATQGVRLLGGLSYIDSEILDTDGGTNNGNRSAGVPKIRAVLGGEWDTPFVRGLTFTARLTHQSSAYIDAANTRKADAWAQVDIGVRYMIERGSAKPIVVRATVDNLLDTAFWSVDTFGGLISSNPRTFKLSTSFDF